MDERDDRHRGEPDGLGHGQNGQRRERPALQPAEEVADAPGDARPEREDRREHGSGGGLNRADRGGRVELVRVVEHGRLGGASAPRVVVAGDRVQELGAHVLGQLARALLDQPQAEVDVAEQPALRRSA